MRPKLRVVNSIARVKAVDTADGAIDALNDLDKRWVVAAGKLIEGVDENPLTLKRAQGHTLGSGAVAEAREFKDLS